MQTLKAISFRNLGTSRVIPRVTSAVELGYVETVGEYKWR